MGSNYTPLFSGGYKVMNSSGGKDARHAANFDEQDALRSVSALGPAS